MKIEIEITNYFDKFKTDLLKYNIELYESKNVVSINSVWKHCDNKKDYIINLNNIYLFAKRKINDDYIGCIIENNIISKIILIHGWTTNNSYEILEVYDSVSEFLNDEELFLNN